MGKCQQITDHMCLIFEALVHDVGGWCQTCACQELTALCEDGALATSQMVQIQRILTLNLTALAGAHPCTVKGQL